MIEAKVSPWPSDEVRCQLQVIGPQVIHNIYLIWLQKKRFSWSRLLGFDYLLKQLTDHKKHILMFIYLFKNMIKDKAEWSYEERHRRVRFGKDLGVGASVPWSWGLSPSWHQDVFTNLEASQTHYCWDFMEASSHKYGQLLTSFPAPLSSFEDRGWAENNQPSSIQELTQS